MEYWRGTENGQLLEKLVQLTANLTDHELHLTEDTIEREFLDIYQWLKRERSRQRVEELIHKPNLDESEKQELRELNLLLAANNIGTKAKESEV